jgi:hypothetical protein
MAPSHTIIAQTRQDILVVFADAVMALAHGEHINVADVRGEVDTILRGLVDAVAKATAHKIRLSDECAAGRLLADPQLELPFMKLSDAFPSKYLKPINVPEPTVATIKTAAEENIKGLDGKEQRKIVLYFSKKLPPLPLNRTNFESIMDICGSDDSDDFHGTKIELFVTKVQGPNGMTDGVRIRAPGVTGKAKPKKAAPNGNEPPFNDEVTY